MSKWSLKNRKADANQAPQMPPELSDYYAAEKRDRRWGVWLLGLATLVVTVILAVLLFFGGRWVIRKFTSNDDVAQVTQTTQTENQDAETTDEPDTADQNDSNDENEEDETPARLGSSDDDSEEGVVDDEAAVDSGEEDLPNTGPADTFAIFAAVTVLAAVAHNLTTRKARG